MKRLGGLIITGILFFSCKYLPEEWHLRKEKKEYIREYYPSGRLKSLNEAVGDKRHGECKYYYESGELKAVAHFNMNKYHGVQISYYKNGKVRGKVNYIDNKKQGSSFGYYQNGKLYIEENYENGKLSGGKKKYYENGKLMMENTYLDGRPSVNLKEYDKNGQLITRYPALRIEGINRIYLDNSYLLKIYFSNKTRSGQFYIDELEQGGYLPEYRIPLETENGIASYYVSAPPGTVIMKKINIIATMKTELGHTRVVSKSYNLAVKH